MSEVRLSRVIGPAFFDLAHDVFQHGHTHYDLSGGRGSLKSSAVSLMVPPLLIANPGTHALVLRKVANTIRDSVYAQYLWAIGELGLAPYWEAKVQPMELIYRPTGQKIMFRGADDPMKIKSIKVPFGYIAVTHFEEKDQFAGRAEIRTILQSTMRGGPQFWSFESYNPPISRDNWANKDSLEERADRMRCKSTYLKAPPEWLGGQFLTEAEELKRADERAYRHEYLGEATGTGGNVFENVTTRAITDEEISHFDRIYQGIDWGYFPDPFHFGRMYYDSAQRKLYIFGEYRDWKKGNRQTFDKLHELFPDVNEYWTTADSGNSDNNKSNADYQSWGMHKLMGAAKGPGSVEAGCKWLQTLAEIIIDPVRCPYTAKEFLSYEYERNKEGDIISGYPDKNNHSLDQTRYALERIWMRRGK